MTASRVIVALDVPTAAEALALARRLDPARCRVKVGKELFTAAGPALVESLMRVGFEVFLDLKFHDIPNTVSGACKAAARLGVWMTNVHASGGRAMLEAAREALETFSSRPLLVGVTVLTSMRERELREVGIEGTTQEAVLRLAALVRMSGLDGVVCSAQEANLIRARSESSFLLVTPGIRPLAAAADDQSRVTTPAEAVSLGANYLVVGRPITRAAEPSAVLDGINREVALALAEGTAR